MAKVNQFKGMRFCEECDNMMEAKEQRVSDTVRWLQFECKLCGYVQKAADKDEVDNCVYRTDFSERAENLKVDPECVNDPTLTRRKDIQCPNCGLNEAVTFTQLTKDKLNLIFVCTNLQCHHNWIKGEGVKDDNESFSEDEDEI